MPGRDGTGPMGQGPMTGRGLGMCKGTYAPKFSLYPARSFRLGRRWRQGLGFRRTYFYTPESEKELLERQKVFLENRLDDINKQLNKL